MCPISGERLKATLSAGEDHIRLPDVNIPARNASKPVLDGYRLGLKLAKTRESRRTDAEASARGQRVGRVVSGQICSRLEDFIRKLKRKKIGFILRASANRIGHPTVLRLEYGWGVFARSEGGQ